MSAVEAELVELRTRNRHFRALLEAMPDLMFRADRHGTYLEAWPEDRADLIVRGKDLVGHTLREVLPPDLAGRLEALIGEVCDGGQIGVTEYDMDINGELLTFEGRVVLCGQDEVLAIVRNVTDRRRSEEQVRGLQVALQGRLVELQASRARIVEAADTERRRVERNIHDGAQQHLLATRLTLTLAAERLRRGDVAGAREVVAEADGQLEAAVDELRALAHGLYPAVLTDEGIGAALVMMARRATVPVRLIEVPAGRLPAALEAAVYFLTSEALTNVTKHANATDAAVSVHRRDTRLVVTVDDNGDGGAREDHGSGLRGLRDRVEALGGELEIQSEPGGGTQVRAEFPCA